MIRQVDAKIWLNDEDSRIAYLGKVYIAEETLREYMQKYREEVTARVVERAATTAREFDMFDRIMWTAIGLGAGLTLSAIFNLVTGSGAA